MPRSSRTLPAELRSATGSLSARIAGETVSCSCTNSCTSPNANGAAAWKNSRRNIWRIGAVVPRISVSARSKMKRATAPARFARTPRPASEFCLIAEKRFVFPFVSRVIRLHLDQIARFLDVNLRPLAVGPFYFRAINDDAVNGFLIHFFHFAAGRIRLKSRLHHRWNILRLHRDAGRFLGTLGERRTSDKQ